MEIISQKLLKENTRGFLYSTVLQAIEARLVSLYDQELHNYNPGVSTGIPHAKLILGMVNTFLKDSGNVTPWGFVKWWSKNNQHKEIFERLEPELLSIARGYALTFDSITGFDFFLDDIDELQFILDDFRNSYLPNPKGLSGVFELRGDLLKCGEEAIQNTLNGGTKGESFDILGILLTLSGRGAFIELLFDGVTLLAVDYPALLVIGNGLGVVFI